MIGRAPKALINPVLWEGTGAGDRHSRKPSHAKMPSSPAPPSLVPWTRFKTSKATHAPTYVGTCTRDLRRKPHRKDRISQLPQLIHRLQYMYLFYSLMGVRFVRAMHIKYCILHAYKQIFVIDPVAIGTHMYM